MYVYMYSTHVMYDTTCVYTYMYTCNVRHYMCVHTCVLSICMGR